MNLQERRPAIVGVALLLLFHVGLFGALVMWFQVIWLGVHDLGHQPYVPTLLGQLWGDHSPLLVLVPVLALATTAILVGSEFAVRRRLVAGNNDFSRILALALAVWMAIPTVFMIYLVQTDLQHVAQPLHIKFVILGLCGLLLGTATMLLFGASRRSVYLWAYVGVPLVLTVGIAFLPEVKQLGLSELSPYLPVGYPSVGFVLPAVTAALGMVVGIRHVVSRRRPEMTSLALLCAGTWCWVLLASACYGALSPLQHMCLSPETDIQPASVKPAIAVFTVCWAEIALVQLRRVRRHKVNAQGPTSTLAEE